MTRILAVPLCLVAGAAWAQSAVQCCNADGTHTVWGTSSVSEADIQAAYGTSGALTQWLGDYGCCTTVGPTWTGHPLSNFNTALISRLTGDQITAPITTAVAPDDLTRAMAICGLHRTAGRVINTPSELGFSAYDEGWEQCDAVLMKWQNAEGARQRHERDDADHAFLRRLLEGK